MEDADGGIATPHKRCPEAQRAATLGADLTPTRAEAH